LKNDSKNPRGGEKRISNEVLFVAEKIKETPLEAERKSSRKAKNQKGQRKISPLKRIIR